MCGLMAGWHGLGRPGSSFVLDFQLRGTETSGTGGYRASTVMRLGRLLRASVPIPARPYSLPTRPGRRANHAPAGRRVARLVRFPRHLGRGRRGFGAARPLVRPAPYYPWLEDRRQRLPMRVRTYGPRLGWDTRRRRRRTDGLSAFRACTATGAGQRHAHARGWRVDGWTAACSRPSTTHTRPAHPCLPRPPCPSRRVWRSRPSGLRRPRFMQSADGWQCARIPPPMAHRRRYVTVMGSAGLTKPRGRRTGQHHVGARPC